MNPSQPTPADIAAAANAVNAPQPQAPPAPATPPVAPEPQAPATPPTQPTQPVAPPVAPTEPADPFASIFTQPTEPTSPTPPAPTPPQQPTEPTPQPQPPVEPQPQAAPQEEEYISFDDYMKETLKDVPQSPEAPNPEDISPDDPQAIKKFFDDLVNTAVQKAKAETIKQNAIQSRERQLWDEAFNKYGSLRDKKPLRDMVHSIRMGYLQRGVAITPKQAADKLLESLGSQYKQGVADNQVVTTIENVQPTAGGSANPVTTSMDKKDMLTAIQDGGETALAQILDAQIKSGKL